MRRNVKATEVSKMRSTGGFRQSSRDTATRIVNDAVESVLGAAARPQLALIAQAITTSSEPASQQVLRRFGLDAATLEQLRAVIVQGYQLSLAEHGKTDPVLGS